MANNEHQFESDIDVHVLSLLRSRLAKFRIGKDLRQHHLNEGIFPDILNKIVLDAYATNDKAFDALLNNAEKYKAFLMTLAGISYDQFRVADRASVNADAPRILSEIGDELKYRSWLPVYSLKAACGPLADGEEVEPEGWVKAEGHGRLDETQFVVRTVGVSMEGLIPEGAYAIFRKLGGGGLSGKTILIQRNDASDPELGGAYTIKRFSRKGDRVILKAKNPKYDITLRDEAEYSTKYRAIAEFKEVL